MLVRYGQNHLAKHSEIRKKRRQTEDIREWTGLKFAKFQTAVENREE